MPKAKSQEQTKYVFKLLRGSHAHGGKKYRCQGKNNIIHTNIELDKRFNSRGSTKFLRLSDEIPEEYESPEEEPQDDYELMSVEELREVADAEEVDLTGITAKSEIITAIKAVTE